MKYVLLVLALIGFSAQSLSLGAAEKPGTKISLPAPIVGLKEGLAALSKTVEPTLATWRAEHRLKGLRENLLKRISEDKAGAPSSISLDPIELLCGSRGSYLIFANQSTYLNAVTAQIESTGTSDVNSLPSAFKAVFSKYSISATPPTKSNEIEAFVSSLENGCVQDVGKYQSLYYGSFEEQEALQFVAGLKALYDVFANVVQPILVEGAKIVDEQKRLKAIRNFLKIPQNRESIKEAATALSSVLLKADTQKRANTLGRYFEVWASYVDVDRQPLDGVSSCKAVIARTGDRIKPTTAENQELDLEFIKCFEEAWTKRKALITDLLTAAERYDALADAAVHTEVEAVTKITNSLAAIAAGKDEATIKDVWNGALRLISLAEKVSEAASDPNRQKVRAALETLVADFD